MAWKLMESNGDRSKDKYQAEYMIDSANDINSPPAENSKLDAGSIAYTADLLNIYQKSAGGQWVKVGGN